MHVIATRVQGTGTSVVPQPRHAATRQQDSALGASVRVRARTCVCACERACRHTLVHAYVHALVHACVHACVGQSHGY